MLDKVALLLNSATDSILSTHQLKEVTHQVPVKTDLHRVTQGVEFTLRSVIHQCELY